MLILLTAVVLPPGLGMLWLWRGWQVEQENIALLEDDGYVPVKVEPLSAVLEHWVPDRWHHLTYRATTYSRDSYGPGDFWRPMSRLRYLRKVSIEEVYLSDDCVAALGGLSQLEQLELTDTSIKDSQLVHLRGLKRLCALTLEGGHWIEGQGLDSLRDLPQLDSLSLVATGVTDAGAAGLRRLTRLRGLDLSYNHISDAALAHVAGMNRLERLGLADTALTDAAVPALSRLGSLRVVDLRGTRLTPEGVRRLQAALPKAQINGPQSQPVR